MVYLEDFVNRHAGDCKTHELLNTVVAWTVLFFRAMLMYEFLAPRVAEAIGTRSMNTALSAMFHEGFFIRAQKSKQIGQQWMLFLQQYAKAAAFAYRSGISRFPLVPKTHYLHHGALRLLREAEQGLTRGSHGWAVNPLGESVQVQEDFIARPSRLSRRVCSKKVHLRTLQRSLVSVSDCFSNLTEMIAACSLGDERCLAIMSI